MSKGPKYFFKLWGRNLKGHVSFFERAIKSGPVKGYALLALGILPVLVLSPFTSLIKTVVDYVSRKPVPKGHQRTVADLPRLIDAMESKKKLAQISSLLGHISEYESRLNLSTMSNSTRALLNTLNTLKTYESTVVEVYCSLGIRAVKTYMLDEKNVDKGMYRHIAAGFAGRDYAFFGNLTAVNGPSSHGKLSETLELLETPGSGGSGYDSPMELP